MSFILRLCLLSLILTSIACSLASWVLLGVNIRKQTKFWGTYSRIDPSFLVASIFATFCYPIVAICPAIATIIIVSLFALWFMGEGIAYTLMKWQWPTRCPAGVPLPSGCVPLYKSILAFAWIDFGLACLLILFVLFLMVRHSKRGGGSGAGVMCWELCSSERPQQRDLEVNNNNDGDGVQNDKQLPTDQDFVPPADNCVQRLKALG